MASNHRTELEAILRADPELMMALELLRRLDLPQGWLVAGAIYQSVWNLICGLPRGTGIRDYDLIYFDDRDLSFEAEDAVIRRAAAASGELKIPVEIRNQARVHLWYERRFGAPYPPLASAEESLRRYATTTHAVGARLERNGCLAVIAPFGLEDIFGMVLRRNPACPAPTTHAEKARRVKAIWPGVRVVG
jgi:hypothetical protein